MVKLAANPNDTSALMDLANLFYRQGDYSGAESWFRKVVALEPRNADAWLALGACNYNLDDNAAAESAWLRVVAIDPRNVEAHYDLGFLYFTQTPRNDAKVREEWGKVIAIAPDSDLAKTLALRLAALPSTAP